MKINYNENLSKIGFFWEKDLDSDNDLLIQVENSNGLIIPKVVFSYNEKTGESRHESWEMYPSRRYFTVSRYDLDKKSINSFIKSDKEIFIKLPWGLSLDELTEVESYLEVESPIDVPNDYFDVGRYKVYFDKGIYYITEIDSSGYHNVIGTCYSGSMYLTLKDYSERYISVVMSMDENDSVSKINKILGILENIDSNSDIKVPSVKIGSLLVEIGKITTIDFINEYSLVEYVKINGMNPRFKQYININ